MRSQPFQNIIDSRLERAQFRLLAAQLQLSRVERHLRAEHGQPRAEADAEPAGHVKRAEKDSGHARKGIGHRRETGRPVTRDTRQRNVNRRVRARQRVCSIGLDAPLPCAMRMPRGSMQRRTLASHNFNAQEYVLKINDKEFTQYQCANAKPRQTDLSRPIGPLVDGSG